MPPEQARGETDRVGPQSDVYSLGAILYCLLTGRPPFKAATSVDTVLQVLNETPVPPREMNPAVPVDLETICLKCLEKPLEARYATADELAQDLQRYLEGRPILARPLSRAAKAVRWCRRNPALATSAIVVAAALLAATAVSSLFAWRSHLSENKALHSSQQLGQQVQIANSATRTAQTQTAIAVEQTRRAEDSRQEALEALTVAEQNQYRSNIQRASEALRAGRFGDLRDALARCPPASRKIEWSLLHRQLFLSRELPRLHRKALLDADERRLYGLWQDRLRCLSLDGLREEFFIESSDFRFSDFVLTADGASIITADEKSVRRWDAANGQLLEEGAQEFVAGNGSTRLALLPNVNKLLVYGSGIALLDLDSWEVSRLAPPRSTRISGSHYRLLAVAPNGRDMAWATSTGELAMAEWTAEKLFFRTAVSGLYGVHYLAFSQDGAQLLTAGSTGVAIVSTARGEIEKQVVNGSRFEWVAADDDTVLAIRSDGVLERRSVVLDNRSLEIPIASSQHNRLPDVTYVSRGVQRPELLVSTEESCHLVSLDGPASSFVIPAGVEGIAWTGDDEIWGIERRKRHSRLAKYDLETGQSEFWELDGISCDLAPLARTVVLGNPDLPTTLGIWRLGTRPDRLPSGHGPATAPAQPLPAEDRRQLSLGARIGAREINRQGTALAVVTDDVLRIYDPTEMRLISQRRLPAELRVLEFSESGESLALQTWDSDVLEVFSWRTNEVLHRIQAKVELLLQFGDENRPYVILERGNSLLLADGETRRSIAPPLELSAFPKRRQFFITADGGRLVALLGNGYGSAAQQSVAICDLKSGDPLAQVPVPDARSVSGQMAWESAGVLETRNALYLSNDSATIVMPLDAAGAAFSVTMPNDEVVGATVVDNSLFLEDDRGNAWVTDLTTGRRHAFSFSSNVKSKIVANGHGRVITVDDSDLIAAQSVEGGTTLWRRPFPGARRCGLVSLEASDRLALAEPDGTLRLLDGTTGEDLAVQQGLSSATRLAAVAQQTDVVAIATRDGGLFLWDVAAGSLRKLASAEAQSQRGEISALALAPDASRLALARTGLGTAEVYSATHDRLADEVAFLSVDLPQIMPGFEFPEIGIRGRDELPLEIFSLEFSEDGKLLLAIGLEFQSEAVVVGEVLKTVRPKPVKRLKAWDGTWVETIAQYPSDHAAAHLANRTTVIERVDDARWEVSDVNLPEMKRSVLLRGISPQSSMPTRMAVTPAILGAQQTEGHPLWIDTLHPRGRVLGCAIAPDGESVIGTDCSGVVRVWRLETGELAAALVGHRGEALACDVGRVSSVAATAGKDGAVRLWDLIGNRQLRRVDAGQPWGTVRAIAMHPQEHVLAATSKDSGLQVWDVELGIPTIQLPEAGRDNYALAWSPDGQSLATAGFSPVVQIWDVIRRRVQIELPLDAIPHVPAVEWSPDGNRIAACDGPDVSIWDPATGRRLLRLATPDTLKAMNLAWSHDGQSLASGGQGRIWLWNAGTGELQHSLEVDGDVLDLAFGNDDQVIVKGGRGSVELWDLGTQQRRWRVPVLPEVTSVVGLDGGSRLAASTFSQIAVWNPQDPDSQQQVATHGATALAATDARSRLAIARGWQPGIQIWDATTQQTTLLAEQDRFQAVAWTSDGAQLAALSTAGAAQVWDVAAGALLHNATGTPQGRRLNWSRDNVDLLLFAPDQDLLRWRPAESAGFEAFKHVRPVAFSKDGSETLGYVRRVGVVLSKWNNGLGRRIASYAVPGDQHFVEFEMDSSESHAATFGLYDGDLFLFDLDSSNVTRWLSPTATDVQWGPGKWLAAARCDGVVDLFDAAHQRIGFWLPLQNGDHFACVPEGVVHLSAEAARQLIAIEEDAAGHQSLRPLDIEVIELLTQEPVVLSSPASMR